MYNIRYLDVYTGTIKSTKHNSADEIQHDRNVEDKSSVLSHLIEVFTEKSDYTTNVEPKTVKLELKDVASLSINVTLNAMGGKELTDTVY